MKIFKQALHDMLMSNSQSVKHPYLEVAKSQLLIIDRERIIGMNSK